MKTMEEAQLRPNESAWVCWICNKQINNMILFPCYTTPRHINGYASVIEGLILTTICHRCLNTSSNHEIQ